MNGHLQERIVRRFKERFAADCIEGILLGYFKMRAENQYKTYWIEDKLTAHLICKMNETGFFAEKSIFIIPQAPLYDEAVIYADGDPAKSPRIDFRFGRYWSRQEFNYFAEAKNISEQNWTKPNRTRPVRADKQSKRYIETGINHYLSGYYPQGCLIGYVVNGTVPGVVSMINNLISHHNKNPQIGLIEQEGASSSDCNYVSHNKVSEGIYTLRHLLLQLA